MQKLFKGFKKKSQTKPKVNNHVLTGEKKQKQEKQQKQQKRQKQLKQSKLFSLRNKIFVAFLIPILFMIIVG